MIFMQKIASFSLTNLLVRFTNPEVVGMASIQLKLLLSTMLFLSREGIRLALLREKILSSNQRQRFINLSWLPAFILFWIGALLVLWQGENRLAIAMYCLGAFFESVGEPWVNIYQKHGTIIPRMQAEAVALFSKSIVTFITVAYFGLGVHGFGIAQISYGLVYYIVLSSYSWTIIMENEYSMRFVDYLPSLTMKSSDVDERSSHLGNAIFDETALSFAITATGSCVLKHVLTEADKIFLSVTQSNHDQGIFAVANDYASLVVRLLFLPIEDASRIAFSKLLADIDKKSDKRQNRDAIVQSKTLLIHLLRVVGLLGIIFPAFGPSYIPLLTSYIFNSKWRGVDMERTLMLFCFQIFILGINGVSEAYCQVVVTASGFKNLNIGLILSFIIFMTFSFLLVGHMGTSGVVCAGAASMIVRIISSYLLIKDKFTDVTSIPLIYSFVPSATQLGSLFLSSFVCYASSLRYNNSKKNIEDAIAHVIVGVLVFGILIFANKKSLVEQILQLGNVLKKHK